MKNLFIITLLLLTCFISNAQENLDKQTNLEEISTFEQTFVHYTKEAMEAGKETVSQAVDFIIDEGIIITKQYIIFTSISYLLPIILGLFLIFWLSRKIYNYTGYSKTHGAIHNNNIDELTGEDYKKPNKLVYILGKYYTNRLTGIINVIISSIPLLLGVILIMSNIFMFIKVTFFSKLYLTELAIKYIS